MATLRSYCFLLYITLAGCSSGNRSLDNTEEVKTVFSVQGDTLSWFDSLRNRIVPVAFYAPQEKNDTFPRQLIIFSHGYGQNRGGDYLTYTYLTEHLASLGCFVVSIQHELPGDSLLATTGDLQVTRRPNWERGVHNILFVLNRLKTLKPTLDYGHVTLIGHSNGGDISVLFAHHYPALIHKVISLDNRRMPWPRADHPRMYSLRSSDQPADTGVLPSIEEQQQFKMKVVRLPATRHNEMDDEASDRQRKEIIQYIEQFVKE
jgi:predicted dienelactone hydrolase